MTTQIEPQSAPSFCSAVAGVLEMLHPFGEGVLALDARSEHGIGYERLWLRAPESGWLPPGLLTFLEGRDDWHLRISPSVRDDSITALPLRTHIVFACWSLRVHHDRSGDPYLDESEVASIRSRLQSFPLRCSFLIDAVGEVVAGWRLARPLSLKLETEIADVLNLQQRLAGVLGASTAPVQHVRPRSQVAQPGDTPIAEEFGAHDPRSFIPLCGRVRNMGSRSAPYDVQIPRVDLGVHFTREEVQRAIQEVAR